MYAVISSLIYSIENLIPKFLKRLDVLSITLLREILILMPLSFFYLFKMDRVAVALILLGVFTSFLPYYLFISGLRIGKIGVVSSFSQTHSLFASIFSWLFFEISISFKLAVGLFLVITGLIIFNLKDLRDGVLNKGSIYGLMAAVMWGLQAVLLKQYFAQVSVGKILFFTELGLFLGAIIYAFFNKHKLIVPKNLKEWSLLSFMAYGIMAALYFYLKAIEIASHPAIPLLVLSSISVLSAVWAYLFLKERLDLHEVIGMAVVLSAIIITSF